MRFIALALICLFSVEAVAQCPGGVCPTNSRRMIFRPRQQQMVPQYVQQVQIGPKYVQPQIVQQMPQQILPIVNGQQVVQVVQQEQLPASLIQPVRLVSVSGPPTELTQSLSNCPCGCANCICNKPPVAVYQQPQVVSSFGSTGSVATTNYGSGGSSFGFSYSAQQNYVPSGVPYQSTSFAGGRYQRRTSGPTWTYSGNNLAAHLEQEHGVNAAGMSYQEMVAAHSDAHNGAVGSTGLGNSFASNRRGPVRRLFGR